MLEKLKGFDLTVFLIVCAFGAIGAILAYFSGFVGLAQLDENWKFHLAMHAPMGALAGTIFIFLIASTDTRNMGRVLTLSALAGFFWQPVIDAGKVYVDRVSEVKDTEEAKKNTESITRTLDGVQRGDLTEEEGRKQTADAINRINFLVPRISDRDLVKRIEANIADMSATSKFRSMPWVIEIISQKLNPNVAEQIWSVPTPGNFSFTDKKGGNTYNFSDAFMKIEAYRQENPPDPQVLLTNPWLQNGWTPDAIKRELDGTSSE